MTKYIETRALAPPPFRGYIIPSPFSAVTDRKSIMDSSEIVIGYHRLDTTFYPDHVQHITYRSDAAQGRRRVRVVEKWYRDQKLGQGSFGTVFLESSEEGGCRAVKEVSKRRDGAVDYRRELIAMAKLARVREIEAPRTLANQIAA